MELVIAVTVGLIMFVVAWSLGAGAMPPLLLLLACVLVGVLARYVKYS